MTSRGRLKYFFLPAALLWLGSSAAGDAVRLVDRLVYDPVKITGIADGRLQFELAGGRAIPPKPLGQVATVKIDGADQLNRAEDLFEQGQYKAAAAGYAAALAGEAVAWRKLLIQYRRMKALEALGAIDEAVELWLAIVDAAGVSRGMLDLRPTRLAPAKSETNDRAIAFLEAKAKQVHAKSKPYHRAVLQALVDFYEQQGRLADAQQLQAILAGRPSAEPGAADATSGPAGADKAMLRLAELALKQCQYEKVIETIVPRLKRLPQAQLPMALRLLGQAQLELAKAQKDEKAARPMLLEAGLNLMRTVVFFPTSEEAPHALVSVGEVNERLGNLIAARAAYSAVGSRFPESPAAIVAKKALERSRSK